MATGLTGLKDVAFNPVSDLVFAAVGINIVQIKATATGYVSSPFITRIVDLQCLAVDAFGNLLFNQRDFVQHRIWRADLNSVAIRLNCCTAAVPKLFDRVMGSFSLVR